MRIPVFANGSRARKPEVIAKIEYWSCLLRCFGKIMRAGNQGVGVNLQADF